uniref:Uncharacterized protein n=1 Tax=Anguilla anguilla TaxID=7936 RepID=A0A0E9WIE2_ANGAN
MSFSMATINKTYSEIFKLQWCRIN